MEYTFDEYKKIIDTCKDCGYQFASYHNYKEYNRAVILRHDVDASLRLADTMAELESDWGVRATYFVLPSSDLYNPNSKDSIAILKHLQRCGHEIGLHFDEKKFVAGSEPWNAQRIVDAILQEKHILEYILGTEVTAVSMHTPSKETLEANLLIPGMINAYGTEFFRSIKYVSDSYHQWRENVWDILSGGEYSHIQLLTHPIWYHESYQSRSDTFRQFIADGSKERYEMVENSMLPPNTTLEASYAEDADGMIGR